MEEGDEANETPEDDGEDDDDVCAICISAKQHPFELNCRHILLTIASRLSSCIIDEHSWMPMFDEICIGQVLLGLAAGMDSPYVFAWLVLEQSMNPRTTFFDNGNTVLHIAASQGSVMVIVWLLKNGFADLADMQNADGKQAVHCTITSKTHTANFILSIFASIQNEHPLPVDWMEHALASEDKFIVDMANEVIRQRIRQGMRSLFESSVSVDDIMKACEEGEYTTCTSCLLSESDGYTEMGSETFLKLIFEFSRHDVLKAFFRLEISSRCFWSKTASDVFAPLLDSCKNDELRKVAEGIVFREETSRKVARKINEFNDVLKKGGTVEEVDKITREQDELIKQLEAADPEQEFYTTKSCRQYASISFDMLFMAGQNPLEYCISINRLDFVDWILQKWTPDLSDLEKALRPHCLAKANLPTLQHIMKLYETHHRPLDVFGKTLSTLISTYMLRSSRLEEDSDEKEKYEHTLQKVEFLAKHPGIDLNSLRSDDRYALNYCTKPWFTSSEDTMRMVKLLVENGADPMITSYRAERRTVLEDFVGCLSSTTLPVVRWLALEKGYDVRFLEPSVYEDDWKKHTAILEEFALIQAAQQTMFDKKSEP
ncbi:hypothetical protein BC829DRAFT_397131 [Chytridium lagenaria]|nr:hypothetical protein BC829DRAFT_397131 [Chytridium lagenaria]